MNFGNFKHGQRVMCTGVQDGNQKAVGKKGKIIGFLNSSDELGNICVVFDEFIGGHDGCSNRDMFTLKKIKGEYGHCWYLPHYKLKLLNQNKRIN
jgi:hypothetical protein